MRRRETPTRWLLAGEYVLGLLSGRARLRFERMAAAERDLAVEVERWERRLGALAEAAPDMAPPARLWRAIDAETRPPVVRESLWNRVQFWRSSDLAVFARPNLWDCVQFWRGVSFATAAAVLALLFIFVVTPRAPEAPAATHVAVLNDSNAEPTWLVRADLGNKEFSIQPLKAAAIPTDKALELWLIAGEGAPPISLGLVPAKGRLSASLAGIPASALTDARAFAVSLEPPGGSPTKLPTGPILYQGPLFKADL
ncbi:MAG: anti-sigma factor [Alphaproteobacteria bacterium]